jgi:hypothetical protein
MKSGISAFLIAVMATACSAQSTLPMKPMTTQSNAAHGVSRVVQTSNGAQIFINGKLADVITIGADGSAAHSMAGRMVVVVSRQRMHPPAKRRLPTAAPMIALSIRRI